MKNPSKPKIKGLDIEPAFANVFNCKSMDLIGHS